MAKKHQKGQISQNGGAQAAPKGPSFGEDSTKAALSALGKLNLIKSQNRGLYGRLSEGASNLAAEVAEGVLPYFSARDKPAAQAISRMSLRSSDIRLDGLSLSGHLLYANNDGSPGMKVSFTSSASSPGRLTCADAKTANSSLSAPSHSFFASSAQGDLPPGLLSLARASRALSEQDDTSKKIWGALPADFQKYWCASLLDSIVTLGLPPRAAASLASEIGYALHSGSAVIESETGDGGKPIYFLDLPNFSVSFSIKDGGEQEVHSISGKEKFLIFATSKLYYQKR